MKHLHVVIASQSDNYSIPYFKKHLSRDNLIIWRFLILIEVYIDGASKGNPGPSGAGVFIKGVQPPVQLSLPLGTMSNHEAEYRALLLALKYCIEHNYSTVSFRTDSQLVERAVEKEYAKIKYLHLF